MTFMEDVCSKPSVWQGKLTPVGELRSYTAHGVRRECTTASESSRFFRCNRARVNGRALP